jgi:hypothetical protein
MRIVARVSQLRAFDSKCIARCLLRQQVGEDATSPPQSCKHSLTNEAWRTFVCAPIAKIAIHAYIGVVRDCACPCSFGLNGLFPRTRKIRI